MSQYTDEEKMEFVLYGAEMIASLDPDWYHKVNLDTLGMISRKYCVLGQVFGPEWMDNLKLIGVTYNPIDPMTQVFASCSEQWIELIRGLQENA